MKKIITTITAVTITAGIAVGGSLKDDIAKLKNKSGAVKLSPEELLKKFVAEAGIVAIDQDELSADVQDLLQEQTDKKVVKLLGEAEELMGEASERLEDKKTGGETIAIETEIIEKMLAAAQEKSKSSSPSEGNQEMLKKMQEMAGQQPGGEPQHEPADQAGTQPGEGATADSDAANEKQEGTAENTKEERKVPASKSIPNNQIPKAERDALDAYNKKSKKP